MWIYLAGPLFTQAEIRFNQTLAQDLREAGYRVFLPQEECAGLTDPSELFVTCLRGLAGASLVLAVLDGPDADSGTCFEVGYAYGRNLPIVGLRTDFRGSGEHLGVNLMLTQSCNHLLLTSLVDHADQETLSYLVVGEAIMPRLIPVLASLPGAQAAQLP